MPKMTHVAVASTTPIRYSINSSCFQIAHFGLCGSGGPYILYPPSNPGKVWLILLREQGAKGAFFRPDLEVVHIHNKRGKQGEGRQVRQECRPSEKKQQETQIHWIPRVLVDA